ncbi:probable glutathione S-transferase GSTU6 [Aspergillus udagawae]|nr:probable glutathione S-transferase GSTU6 [Aspergillus udagawae]
MKSPGVLKLLQNISSTQVRPYIAMASDSPVHFFDITSTLPGSSKSWSPNTIKTRMVLNYKRIPYTQSWVSYPDIAPLLTSLAVPANPDGIAYTLPTINHKPTVKSNPTGTLTESFAIACHLDQHYPTPSLFPSGDASYALTIAVGKLLSAAVGKARPLIVPNVADILDDRGREYFIKTRSAWFGKPLSEVRPRDPQQVKEATDELKKELEVLAQMLRGKVGKTGPFFEGDKPGYADFIVVSFLAWAERADKELWRELLGAGQGEFKALWEACIPWVEGQGEEKDWPIAE